jgi:predicted nucleic acid-binding protein
MLVIETASGVARATGQSAFAHRAATQLYNLPFIRIVPIDQNLVNETTRVAADYKLRGADAVFVALAKIEAVPLVTFDQEQQTRPVGVIATIHP